MKTKKTRQPHYEFPESIMLIKFFPLCYENLILPYWHLLKLLISINPKQYLVNKRHIIVDLLGLIFGLVLLYLFSNLLHITPITFGIYFGLIVACFIIGYRRRIVPLEKTYSQDEIQKIYGTSINNINKQSSIQSRANLNYRNPQAPILRQNISSVKSVEGKRYLTFDNEEQLNEWLKDKPNINIELPPK